MELTAFDGLGWFLLALVPFLIVNRFLHQEIHRILFLIFRNQAVAMTVFSFFFLPGVIIHEGSHFLMAKILRVPTGKVSFIPHQLPGGKMRLGYVEIRKSDFLRESVIGAAPLLIGGAAVACIGLFGFRLSSATVFVENGDWRALVASFETITQQPDFWLYFYLAFVISSMMLPSASDRQTWLPIILFLVFLLAIVMIAGGGSWLLNHAAPQVNLVMRAIAAIFWISLLTHILLLIPLFIVRIIIEKIPVLFTRENYRAH